MKKLLPLKKYRDLLKYWPVFTVDVVFLNKDMTKILLFKRSNNPLRGEYYTIGGRLNKNERIIDCAVRQAQKEVGINVDKKRLIYGGIQEEMHTNSIFKNISYHALTLFFGYKIENEKIKLDSQHSEYKWFFIRDKRIHPLIKTKLKQTTNKFKTKRSNRYE